MALRNNFRVTKKFLITKFDCIIAICRICQWWSFLIASNAAILGVTLWLTGTFWLNLSPDLHKIWLVLSKLFFSFTGFFIIYRLWSFNYYTIQCNFLINLIFKRRYFMTIYWLKLMVVIRQARAEIWQEFGWRFEDTKILFWDYITDL